MAVNSVAHHGRPACNSCGFCSGFGCPTNARGGAAVSFLHRALQLGAQLKSRCFVYDVSRSRDGRRVTGVSWVDADGRRHHESADVVILAASAIETPRLMMLSGIPDPSGQLGRNLMFHFFTLGLAVFADPVDAWRGPSTTFTIDDFVGPEKGAAVKALGLPYLKGGICEVGATFPLMEEAGIYSAIPETWGVVHKTLMRAGLIRKHVAGLSMVGEDMPQLANHVDLDPQIRDVYGFQVPRITRSAHRFEILASAYFGARIAAVCEAAPGSLLGAVIPAGEIVELTGGDASFFAGPASTAHIMGTARMGLSAESSVTDAFGRVHSVENLHVNDGSVFVSSAGMNPTVTIMALSLRAARQIV
jgi:choline dehydrogenase-like flavoprotein